MRAAEWTHHINYVEHGDGLDASIIYKAHKITIELQFTIIVAEAPIFIVYPVPEK